MPPPAARPAAARPRGKNERPAVAAAKTSAGSSSTAPSSEAGVTPGTGWGGVAGWYDRMLAEDDSYQRKVILPNLLRLMRPAPGQTVLDLACGQGFFSAAFRKEGAAVVGADVSEELVALARFHAPDATFHVALADKLRMISDASVDQAAIVLAVQNIENPRAAFAECARVLKAGGRLHLVINHPSFRVPKRSAWGWDAAGHQYRRVDGYLTESKAEIEMHPGRDPSARTTSFHRPLQYYVKALARTGFAVANLEEWTSHKISDSGPRASEENRARKEIPLFMYIEAKKPCP